MLKTGISIRKVQLILRVLGSDGKMISDLPLETFGTDWQEVKFSVPNIKTDEQASLEITATGTGTIYMDYLSIMRSDLRKNGMMRPDLVQSLKDLKPSFIRWPGGSFASIYKWKDGIGRRCRANSIQIQYGEDIQIIMVLVPMSLWSFVGNRIPIR